MASHTPTQAAQYRQLAEEIRTLFATWSDPETRAELAWMAACYERLADFATEAGKRSTTRIRRMPIH